MVQRLAAKWLFEDSAPSPVQVYEDLSWFESGSA
jgi:hypothetical protein